MTAALAMPAQVDPKDLTAGQLAALRAVRSYRLVRVKGGWRCPGSPLVTLATAAALERRRLVVERFDAGRRHLALTGTGRNTLAVAEQRSRRHGGPLA